MSHLKINLVTPEKLFLSAEVEMLVVPGEMGDFGAMYGHAPFISSIRTGVIEVHNPGEDTRRIFVSGGFAEVNGESCTILAEELLDVSAINAETTRTALDDARYSLEHSSGDAEKLLLQNVINLAEAKLQVIGAS